MSLYIAWASTAMCLVNIIVLLFVLRKTRSELETLKQRYEEEE
mgnify:CR=1 FL=1